MKVKNILPLTWRNELENSEFYSIDNDIILLDKPVISSTIKYPFKVDVTVAIICIKGTMEGTLNLHPCFNGASSFITILPGQIMQYKSISEDFEGLFIIMSPKFSDSLMPNAKDRLPLSLSVRDNPSVSLDEEGLKGMINYFEMLKKIIQVEDHPYRIEVARYLTLAFFYGVGSHFHNFDDNRKKSHYETLSEKFLNLVQIHFKEQRGLEFYANKLYITPKHLTIVIKSVSNKSPNEWIDEYVTLETKALLKSTNMTIQQISDALNFPSQSFFGKYFKRVTGMSPSEYKAKG
ncbi:MAG: helix-turn-helix domain-containing protein [Tannerella sp.]|jgi:AraC-like DNA-binding protein|nr:helix-turn-helix domain-containing protein [Tannerella sp.]